MSRFKERYDNDPEFKQRHSEYMKQKIQCTCGCQVARHNLTKHKRTKKHEQYTATQTKQQDIDKLMLKMNELLTMLSTDKQ